MIVSPPSHLTAAYYDSQRRLALLRLLLPLVTGVVGLGSLYFTVRLLLVPGDRQLVIFANYGSDLVLFAGFAIGWLALHRGAVRLASALIVATGSVGFMLAVLLRAALFGIDAIELLEFLIFGAVLVLTSLFSGRRVVVVMTIVLNVITIACIVLGKLLHPSVDVFGLTGTPLGLAIPLLLLFEWFTAIFLIVQRGSYYQVVQQLGAAVDDLRQLDDLKDQFIAHVNHELRNPIMTVRGTIEYLFLARERLDSGELEELLGKAIRTSDGLMHLLNSILDVRSIEGAMFEPQPVGVRQALDDAIVLLNPLDGRMGQRDMRITIAPDLRVMADATRLQQILTNLLSNALKYTPEGTAIDVSAASIAPSPDQHHQATGPGQVEIQVRDYGPGIPPEQIPLLFRRFVRLPRDLGSNVTGSGLGLYLCRLFAEAMGGRIWAESTGSEGEGATFHLILPGATTTLVPESTPASQPDKNVSPPRMTHPLAPARPRAKSLATDAYLIPNDLQESQRLDFQHFIMREAFQGNSLAPIDNPKRILDVATGTGRWAVEMARAFPDAEVVGIDVAEPKAAYTERDVLPPVNYQFRQVNLLDGLPFPDATFDYVHMRFISIGLPIARWPGVVRDLARVTARDGWVELMEAMPMEGGGPAIERLLSVLVEASRGRGMQPLQESQLGEWLREAGLHNVQARTERLPFGNTQGRLGHYMALDIFTGMRSVGGSLAQAGIIDRATFDQLVQQADEEVHSGQYHCVIPIYLAYGQRP